MNDLYNTFEELMVLINEGSYAKLKDELNGYNPATLAEFFDELPVDKQLFTFRLLTKDNAASVFSYMDIDTQEHIVNSITDNEVRNIVDEMFLDDAVDFLSEIPANLVTKVLRNTDDTKRKLINQFLNYPENSAGSIMTIEFVQFNENMTVKGAMEQLRKTGLDKETIYNCYVIDSSRTLLGVIALRTLILTQDETLVKDIMETRVINVNTLDDQEDVAQIFRKYNFIALPVVDNERRLVGIITIDDIMDVVDKEATEDIEKMSALIPSEDEYLKTSVFVLAKNRVVWLLVLMISGTVSSAIIGKYETVLATTVVLASFIPILMDTGGNAGSQASTLIIRGMALGEITTKDIFIVIWKEIRVGIISGVILGATNFFRLYLLSDVSITINLVISFCIAIVVIIAKATGCVLPMLAKKFKFDPAIMAGPLITTIVDSMALIILFRLAMMFIL